MYHHSLLVSTPPKVSVLIVSYNTRDLVREALSAVAEQFETCVVDNASTDGTAAMVANEFPGVTLIANPTNRGFGAANNQGFDAVHGDLVLLLNSDARPDAGAIEALAKEFDDPSVIAAGGLLRFPDGRVQESACSNLTPWAVFCEQTLLEKLFPTSPLFSPYWQSKRLLSKGDGPHPVEQVMGSFLMMRHPRHHGERFDERYFLYCEDTDLCFRLRRHGKILYVPAAPAVHELGKSSEDTRWQAVSRYNAGKELFFRLHWSEASSALVLVMNRLGALLRLIIWGVPTVLTLGLIRRLRRQAVLFFKVLTCPISGPPLPPDTRSKPVPDRRPS